jgi:hypothetical protein
MSVTVHDILDFLEERVTKAGRTFACPVCGSRDWVLPSEDSLKGVISTGGAEDKPSDMARYYPVLRVRCGYCSNTLFFGLKALRRLMEGSES